MKRSSVWDVDSEELLEAVSGQFDPGEKKAKKNRIFDLMGRQDPTVIAVRWPQ